MTAEQSQQPQWLVGIDLGTSHTAVAASRLSDPQRSEIEGYDLLQWVGVGSADRRPLLPSVCYQATADEIGEDDAVLPGRSRNPAASSDAIFVLGELARQWGAKTPGRLITSAKSWLSHAAVDPTASILPWGAPDEVTKISPLEASSRYLAHVRDDWNHRHPEAPLEAQDVTITVPASFDESARQLTCEAARMAGLHSFQLVEEPQAVFYDWLWREKDRLKDELKGVRLLLVMDLGGGTLDLTLISVHEGTPVPTFERIAVGQHLMLGGDNIDLALAHLAEKKLNEAGKKVQPAEYALLVEQCRQAKERLLASDAPDDCHVTLLGEGGRLIGGTRSVRLSQAEVLPLVLEGFFPRVNPDEHPDRRRSGVVEFGLPYARDPAITRHLSGFLNEHRHAMAAALGTSENDVLLPDALLLNGGIFKSDRVVSHLREQFSLWGADHLRFLENPRPESSVAYGAVASGWARHGGRVQKIGGGAARSLYLVLDGEGGASKGCCLLPKGTEEGQAIILSDRRFNLKVGAAVRFHLVTSLDDRIPEPGQVVDLVPDQFVPLPPLNLVLEPRGVTSDTIAVELVAALSPIGTLDLECVALNQPDKRWKIEFQLRSKAKATLPLPSGSVHSSIEQVRSLILLVFGPASKAVDHKDVKRLRSDLEQLLGPKEEWSIALLRDIAQILLEGMPNRRRSAVHERVWLNLTGYCLRPGFGHPLDALLLERLAGGLAQQPQFIQESQVWSEWWTLWRRLAGGLDPLRQQELFKMGIPYLEPSRLRRPAQVELAKKRGPDDLVRMVASLEHLSPKDKLRLGEWILGRIEKRGDTRVLWWCLGRLGARSPWHGSAHNVIRPEAVLPWLNRALREDFRKNPEAALSAALMARLTEDRLLDVDADVRERVIRQLTDARQPEGWIQWVSEGSNLSASDEQRVLGDALPPGLELINEPNLS